MKILYFLLTVIFFLPACAVKDYPSNSKPVSHNIWDSLLQKNVDESGLVNYKGFIQDSSELNQYLQLLSKNHPNEKNWSKDEQLAYWLNAYNAFTVQLVIRHYPVVSIKDIKNGIPFVNTVWDIKFIKIEKAEYDLNNIEHGIVRPKFEDPRVHFALNCASKSCPRLRNEAYVAEKLDRQLIDQAKYFLADESKNKISRDKLELSKIFSWFAGDFTKKGSLIDFLNLYAPLKIKPDARIEYLDYDWGLNE